MASIAQLDSDSAELKKRIERFQTVRDNILAQVRQVIVGQEEVLDQILISLFVGGHCLITGLPGTAKTLMVRTMSETLGLAFKRIQFTPDLMPSDITGTDIIEEDQATGRRTWTFVQGPIFANILLATQNPIELEGTYPLPEAQLDRFLFNTVLDYLSADEEMQVVDLTTTTHVAEADAVTSAEEILGFQQLVRMVPIGESVARYAVDMVRATRSSDDSSPDFVKKYINYGGSVRA